MKALPGLYLKVRLHLRERLSRKDEQADSGLYTPKALEKAFISHKSASWVQTFLGLRVFDT